MARIKVGDRQNKKEKKQNIATSDPGMLDKIRAAGKEYQQTKKPAEEKEAKMVSEENMSKMPDADFQGLREKLISKKSGANAAPVEDRQGQDEQPIDDSEVDAEEAAMDQEDLPDLKPEDRVKEGAFGMENFKKAFSYFGPRMAAMLLGGESALNFTDDLLTGYREEQQQQGLDPVTATRLQQAQERINLQRRGEQAKQKRFDKSYSFKKKMSERPGGKIMLEQASQKTLLSHLDALDKLASSVDQEYRGPLAGLGKDWAVKYGLSNDKDWAMFSSRSNMVLNSYIKSITGAQSGAEEQARLGKDVPSPRDNPTVFAAKSKMMREAAEGRMTAVNESLEKYGYKADDGTFSGKGLSKEQREANANIAAGVLADKLAELSAQNKESKPASGLSAQEQAELEQLRKEASEGKF